MYTVISPQVLHLWIQLTTDLQKYIFSTHGWESDDEEGQLYALSHAILYKELEPTYILIFMGVLEPSPHGYQRMTAVKFLGSQKIHVEF